MITVEHYGSFSKLEAFLKKVKNMNLDTMLQTVAQEGVNALKSVTPLESGETAGSWYYTIESSKSQIRIVWSNSHVVSGIPIAIILQYGHGTGTGGYVQGRDYINPAIKPIFDKIADDVWKVVTSA